jgi:hypothetical protein
MGTLAGGLALAAAHEVLLVLVFEELQLDVEKLEILDDVHSELGHSPSIGGRREALEHPPAGISGAGAASGS